MTESIQILMEKDRLQPLADNIKVLKGSNSITLQQMEDTIEETNTDIVSQTDLIAQLASALQGKSVPGGSAGVKTYAVCMYLDSSSNIVLPEIRIDGNLLQAVDVSCLVIFHAAPGQVISFDGYGIANLYTVKTSNSNNITMNSTYLGEDPSGMSDLYEHSFVMPESDVWVTDKRLNLNIYVL